jgi:hypothetical protein
MCAIASWPGHVFAAKPNWKVGTKFSTLVLKFVLFLAKKFTYHRHSGAGRNPVCGSAVVFPGCRIKSGMTREFNTLLVLAWPG